MSGSNSDEANRRFNPLDKNNLGLSVADAVLGRPVKKLGALESFGGAGVYAMYYTGEFAPYAPIASRNRNGLFVCPIYVGKAVPAGARKGGFELDLPSGPDLYRRLAEHARSIEEAENLELEHFCCRYLVVDDIWIPLGESLLIEHFSPLWNKLVDGFGNHDPGSGRYKQRRSAWDVLHPGRSWAQRCQQGEKTIKQLLKEVEQYLNEVLG